MARWRPLRLRTCDLSQARTLLQQGVHPGRSRVSRYVLIMAFIPSIGRALGPLPPTGPGPTGSSRRPRTPIPPSRGGSTTAAPTSANPRPATSRAQSPYSHPRRGLPWRRTPITTDDQHLTEPLREPGGHPSTAPASRDVHGTDQRISPATHAPASQGSADPASLPSLRVSTFPTLSTEVQALCYLCPLARERTRPHPPPSTRPRGTTGSAFSRNRSQSTTHTPPTAPPLHRSTAPPLHRSRVCHGGPPNDKATPAQRSFA